jgi:hypothetical protein
VNARAWVVGLAGLGIGALLALRVMIPNGMDPTVFVAFGEDAPVQTRYGRDLLGDVRVRRDLGHDGKFFFAQANDPWYLDPDRHAVVLDRPIYRAQRMFFPLIAGGLGAFPPGVVVWAMLVTNLLALAVGAFLAARLAEGLGASPWLGLWVPLNPGLLFELDIGGAGIVAYASALGAVYALTRGHVMPAALLFTAAALSRETMLAFAAGTFVLWWIDRRRTAWSLLAVPITGMAVWNAYLWLRLDGIDGTGSGAINFGLPFVGLVDAFRSWITEPFDLLLSAVLLAVVVAFVPVAVRSRLPIAWGALPFAALVVVLSATVLREPFDFSRAVAPIFTAFPFVLLVRDRARVAPDGSADPQRVLHRRAAT